MVNLLISIKDYINLDLSNYVVFKVIPLFDFEFLTLLNKIKVKINQTGVD